MEEQKTNQDKEPMNSLTARIDEQLAKLLEPLGVRAEAASEPEQRLLQTTTGETEARVTLSYLHLRCRNAQRLSVLAQLMTLLNFYLNEANCVANGTTSKQQEGYLVFASATPFPQAVIGWISTQDIITDWFCHTVAIDLEME